MRIDDLREAIAARIEAVPDVGIVQRFHRYAPGMKDFKTLFLFTDSKGSQRLQAWTISRTSWSRELVARSGRVQTDRWKLTFYLSLSDGDESELMFDRLLDLVAAAFEEDRTLGGLVQAPAGDGDLIQLTDARPVKFADVLCHRAELSFATRSDVSVSLTEELPDYLETRTSWRMPDALPDTEAGADLQDMREDLPA